VKVDVVMPVKDRVEPCLKECLEAMEEEVPINRFIVLDGYSTDGTVELIQSFCEENEIELVLEQTDASLGKCREKGIRKVETEWFLFLDSDAVLQESFWDALTSEISEDVGAVQGRKLRTTDPSDPEYAESSQEWVRRRSFRGTTISTLVRTEAVRSITIPRDLQVWEDEFIRQYVEGRNLANKDSTYYVDISNGNEYKWVFCSDAFYEVNQSDSFEKRELDGRIFARYPEFKPAYRVLGKPLRTRDLADLKVAKGFLKEKLGGVLS